MKMISTEKKAKGKEKKDIGQRPPAPLIIKEAKRPLTSIEIKDVLSFIKPNPYIPKDVADIAAKNAHKTFKKKLLTLQIYPCMIPQLKKDLEKSYLSSLIPPGSSVGVITAQSIGEKQTQTNLNSLDWFEKVLYTCENKGGMGGKDSRVIVEYIGEMIDRILNNERASGKIKIDGKTEYLEIKEKNLYIPSSDEKGFCGWYLIEAVTRHLPNGKLVKVVTQSGRTVMASQGMSFLVWDNKGENFIPTNGSDLRVGDILPTTRKLPLPKTTNEYFNTRSIFPPTEYLYTTEILKALEYKKSKVKNWWANHINKDFFLP